MFTFLHTRFLLLALVCNFFIDLEKINSIPSVIIFVNRGALFSLGVPPLSILKMVNPDAFVLMLPQNGCNPSSLSAILRPVQRLQFILIWGSCDSVCSRVQEPTADHTKCMWVDSIKSFSDKHLWIPIIFNLSPNQLFIYTEHIIFAPSILLHSLFASLIIIFPGVECLLPRSIALLPALFLLKVLLSLLVFLFPCVLTLGGAFFRIHLLTTAPFILHKR